MRLIEGRYNTAKVFTDIVEEGAIVQIKSLCDQEYTKESKIRIMPDVHEGVGCTIGTIIIHLLTIKKRDIFIIISDKRVFMGKYDRSYIKF